MKWGDEKSLSKGACSDSTKRLEATGRKRNTPLHKCRQSTCFGGVWLYPQAYWGKKVLFRGLCRGVVLIYTNNPATDMGSLLFL